MGLKIRLFNIISSNTYTLRYKSGASAWPEYDDTTFTLYNTGLTSSTIEIDNLMFNTQYWFKIIDEISNRYIIKNINTHSSESFPCYDLVPIPTSTPLPTSTSIPPTNTPTSTSIPPTNTPTSTSIPPTNTIVLPTPTNTETPTITPTFIPPNCSCWSFENIGIGVANVSYDECNSGPTQTNVDIGATIYKCVTYGQNPSTNSGEFIILSLSNGENTD